MNLYRYPIPFTVFFFLFTSLPFISWSQLSVNLTIESGTSTTTCRDILSSPEPRWSVRVNNEDWVTYPEAGGCFQDFPFVQYDSTFNCPVDVPPTINVCFRAFEDDGRNCNLDMKCLEEICMDFPLPLPGTDANFTLALPPGLSSGGSVDFSIQTSGNFVGGLNDIPCTAFDLGLLPSVSATIGDADLSTYNNFCATNLGEPNPVSNGRFFNDQAVWFTFVTPIAEEISRVEINTKSDPENLGMPMGLQLALYTSLTDTCSTADQFVRADFDPRTLDQSMILNCLEPSTRYWLMVDANGGGGLNVEGYFGLELKVFDGILGPDDICDAINLGTIPEGGSEIITDQVNYCSDAVNEPRPRAFVHQHTVWYAFQPPSSGHVYINGISDPTIQEDDIDLQLALFTSQNGQCDGPLIEITSQYRINTVGERMRATCLIPGQTYYVMIDGSGSNTYGQFDLEVEDGGRLNPQYTTNYYEEICFGDSVVIGNSVFKRDTTFSEVLKATTGCDSLVRGQVVFLPLNETIIDTIICAGDSYEAGTSTYTTSGDFTDVLTDQNGCDSFITSRVFVLDPIVVDANMAAEASGYLTPDGTANVTATGGNGPYTYLWSDGQTGAIAFNLEGGREYCVTVTDRQGCTAEDCALIFFPSNIQNLVINDTLTCIGDSNGVLSISISNGAWPYDFEWENADGTRTGNGTILTEGGTATIQNLPLGNYSFTISDGFGFAAAYGSVVNPEPIVTTLSEVLCFGDSLIIGTDVYKSTGSINTLLSSFEGCDSTVNGSLIVLPLNETVLNRTICFGEQIRVGNQDYNTSGPINELLTAANGCDSLVTGTLTVLDEIATTLDTTVCAGEVVQEGNNIYSISDTYVNVYPVANGCDSTVTLNLTVLNPVTVNMIVAQASGLGNQDGVATLQVQGGSGNYAYLWSDGSSVATRTNLEGGLPYCVTVTDEFGCSAQTCQVILFPVNIRSVVQNDTLNCIGDTDGFITFSAFNGEPPYTYDWSSATDITLNGTGTILTENGTGSLTNLPAGQYDLTLKDKWGETNHTAFVINPDTLLGEIVFINSTSCFGICDGTAQFKISGGTGPYRIDNDVVDSIYTIDQLCGDQNLSITAFDAKGCFVNITFEITQPEEIALSVTLVKEVQCFGEANGQTRVETNAINPTYLWDNGETSVLAVGLEAGIHSVTVTDQNGCSKSATVNMIEPAVPLSTNVEILEPISCFGAFDGALTARSIGGNNVSYLWSNNDTSTIITDLSAGTYTVTITDERGCTTENSIELTQPEELNMTFQTNDVTCTGGELSGSVLVDTVRGGVGPYLFSLDDGGLSAQDAFSGLGSGTYDLKVEDALGCIQSYRATVGDPAFVAVSISGDKELQLGESTNLFSNTSSDFPIYTWSSTSDSINCIDCETIEVTPYFTTTYSLTVVDSVSGCTDTDQITILVNKDRNVFVPNVFSPNDDGINDEFEVFSDVSIDVIEQLSIFNRWGEKVFETNGITSGDSGRFWKGNHGSEKAPTGVYVYRMSVLYLDGYREVIAGDVTLVR